MQNGLNGEKRGGPNTKMHTCAVQQTDGWRTPVNLSQTRPVLSLVLLN